MDILNDELPAQSSWRVVIAKAIEQQIGNRRGQRVQKIAHVERGQKTRDAAAERAGFGNRIRFNEDLKPEKNA